MDVSGLTAVEVAIADLAEKQGADNPIGTARAATSMGYTGVNEFSTDTPVDTQVDQAMDARVANNPTAAQLGINAQLEKGFQTANPTTVAATNALAGLLSKTSPAIAATLAVGNIVNAATGREGLGVGEVFGLDISGTIGEQLSGIAQDVVDFSETVPGNIEDTIDAGVEAGKEAGGTDEDSRKKQNTLPDLNTLLNKTMKIDGINEEIPVRNSLMSQPITT